MKRGNQRPRATLAREVHAAQKVLKVPVRAKEEGGAYLPLLVPVLRVRPGNPEWVHRTLAKDGFAGRLRKYGPSLEMPDRSPVTAKCRRTHSNTRTGHYAPPQPAATILPSRIISTTLTRIFTNSDNLQQTYA